MMHNSACLLLFFAIVEVICTMHNSAYLFRLLWNGYDFTRYEHLYSTSSPKTPYLLLPRKAVGGLEQDHIALFSLNMDH